MILVMTHPTSTLQVKRLAPLGYLNQAHVDLKLACGLSQFCLVQIVRRQNKAMDVYMCDTGDQEMKLQLRALDESLAESTRLSKLVELAAIEPGKYLHLAPHSFTPSLPHLLAACFLTHCNELELQQAVLCVMPGTAHDLVQQKLQQTLCNTTRCSTTRLMSKECCCVCS